MKKGSTFPFDPDSFISGTLEMTNEQKGIYITLLSFQWTRNGLPDDQNILARFCSCDRNAIASILHKFPLWPDGIRRNERLERDRQKSNARSESNALNAYERHGKAPKSDEAKKIADIFHRRHGTEWADNEITGFRKIKDAIALKDLELIHKWYESERAKGEEGRQRRNLDTFLNNYLGELDKAREWEASMKRKSGNLNGNGHGSVKKPNGFDAWFSENYIGSMYESSSRATQESLVNEYRRTMK